MDIALTQEKADKLRTALVDFNIALRECVDAGVSVSAEISTGIMPDRPAYCDSLTAINIVSITAIVKF